MKRRPQAVSDLKLKTDLNYNAASFLMQIKDAKDVLDYIRRIENLNAVYEVLFDKAQLAVTCNDCPFIEDCLNKGNKTEDCQIKMINRANELGVSVE